MGYLRLLGDRRVLVLWSSGALSVLGNRLYGLAVMWVVYAATGSASLMGLVAVVESVPYIVLGTVGRRVVARCASFRRLAVLDAGRALVTCAIPLLWTSERGGMVVLLALVAVLGALGALFDPALGALTPEIVGEGQVRQVTALVDLTTRLAAIVGPGCVGLILLVVSEPQLFVLDGVTFAVSALALCWLGAHTRRATSTTAVVAAAAAGRVRADAPAAWPVLRAYPGVAVAIALHGAGFFVAAVTALGIPAVLVARLGQGAGGYGLVLAAIGAGALAGNLVVGNLRTRQWLRVYCGAWAVTGVALAGISAARSLPLVMACGVLSGLASPFAAVTLRTRLSRFTPAVRLRLLTVDQTVIRTSGTVGMLVLPFAIDAAPAGAFAAAGVFLVVVAGCAGLAGRRARVTVRALPAAAVRVPETAGSAS
ncbi:MFS transporter [Micromonospora aurantiaca (nom. illeg.)]|uniref:MFS transporter n=1 Tax=Micromonospora aurantiaca (nom. illeg.) TaxID=47850 RepID=UPI0033E22419